MIPLRLRLKNFMCYREACEPLDFTGFRMACLSGENGHGKSSLLDAITWVLWGQSRAKTEDELVAVGAADMEVEFEFALGEGWYRVIRKRSRRKGPSVPTLELQVRSGEGYRSLTGNSVRDTEKAIIQLLRLDYDTFVNSAFLLQGKADSFTTQTPNDRKRILAEILGLGQYDKLEERARELVRERKNVVEHCNGEIARIDGELAKRPHFERELTQALVDLEQLDESLGSLSNQVNDEQVRKNQLEERRARRPEIERRLARDRRRQSDCRLRRVELDDRIAQLERTITERPTIEDGYRRLERARALLDDYGVRAGQLHALQEQREKLVRRIDRERARHEGERRTLADRISRLSPTGQDAGRLDAALAAAQEALAQNANLQAALDRKKRDLNEKTDLAGELRGKLSQLRSEMDDIKRVLSEIEDAARCPICTRPLTAADRTRLLAEHQARGTARGDEYRSEAKRLRGLEAERDDLKATVEREEGELIKRGQAEERRVGSLRQQVEDAGRALAEIEAVRPKLSEVERLLADEQFCLDERRELGDLEAQITAIGFDGAILEGARKAAKELEPFQARYQLLMTADTQRTSAEQEIGEVDTEITELDDRIGEHERDLAQLTGTDAELQAIDARLHRLRNDLADTNQARRDAENRKGRAEQQIDTCRYYEQERARQVGHRDDAARELDIYQELVLAFGRRGVQAMIIEAVLPEIEQEANEILGRMTDSRMQVAFETQRATQKGGQVETLDIRIADELGLRNYELFSGGEAFRINFAIRVALAKLLARRAGARLETLVIDEGFGTQDASGRDRLVEAIRSIEDDFAKIIVVTHIDELKELFPTRIEVQKTAAGSTLTVVQR